MAVVEFHLQKLEGAWKSGYALDLHTTSSVLIGESETGRPQFVTVRPPIAQKLFMLKYRRDADAVRDIVDTAVSFLTPHRGKFDVIVPVPPSTVREIQPVLLLAEGIGKALGIPLLDCVKLTRTAVGIKDVTEPEARKRLLEGLHTVAAGATRGKNVLLFDDLFRSGATMNAITDVLLGRGAAASVRVVTITKSRSNQ